MYMINLHLLLLLLLVPLPPPLSILALAGILTRGDRLISSFLHLGTRGLVTGGARSVVHVSGRKRLQAVQPFYYRNQRFLCVCSSFLVTKTKNDLRRARFSNGFFSNTRWLLHIQGSICFMLGVGALQTEAGLYHKIFSFKT